MHTSGTCHQKFRCSKFDDFFDHQIWGGVVNKFSSRGFRKFLSPFFLAKNKSFEQKTPFETKNSGLQWLFEDLSSSRKNPQNRIFTHFQISGEITKEMVFLRISGEITAGNWIDVVNWLPFHVSDVCKSHFLRVEKVTGVPQGPKLIISKKKSLTCQNVTFWNRHDLPHMS